MKTKACNNVYMMQLSELLPHEVPRLLSLTSLQWGDTFHLLCPRDVHEVQRHVRKGICQTMAEDNSNQDDRLLSNKEDDDFLKELVS